MSSFDPQSSVSLNVEAMRQRPKARLQPDPKAPLREPMREVMRFLHYPPRTEETYWQWTERFLRFHRRPGGDAAGPVVWRHPRDLGADDGVAFLGHLASGREVAAATQNQAPDALIFLYQETSGTGLRPLQGNLGGRIARRHRPVACDTRIRSRPLIPSPAR